MHKRCLTPTDDNVVLGAQMNDTAPQAVVPTVNEPAHAKHGPSSLKYKEICPSFANREGSNWASDKGDRIHAAMELDDPSKCANDEERAIYESLQGFVGSIMKQSTWK